MLEKQKEFAAEQQRIAAAELEFEKHKAKVDGGLSIARERLGLARLEAQILTASGEQALKLAKDREATLKRIVALEETMAEQIRQAELSAATKKANEAKSTFDVAGVSVDSARERASQTGQAVDRAAEVLANATAERIKTIDTLIGLRDDAKRGRENATSPNDAIEFTTLIKNLDDKIKAALDGPGELEARAQAEKEQAVKADKEAQENFKKASEDQKSAARDLKAATEALNNLSLNQGLDRRNEAGQRNISDLAGLDEKKAAAGAATAGDIGQTLTEIIRALGDAANAPGIQKTIQRVKELAADGVQGGEQNEVVTLVGSLVQRIKDSGDQNAKFMQRIIAAVDSSVTKQKEYDGRISELERKVKDVVSNQGTRNH